MRTYLQVTLGILTARLLIALILTRVIKRITGAETERLKVKSQQALAVALADELERRYRELERNAWR